MIIKAPHPSIAEPKTYLTASQAAAATAATVANNAGFTAADYTVIGKVGQEGAEIHKISTLGTTVTINYSGDAISFAHSTNTEVAFIKYNQVKFYLGDWSARYSTGTISITKDSATVTGSGTSWGSITTNYALLINGKWYDIKSVDSATQITLTANFTDETIESQDYSLVAFSSQATVSIAIDQEATQWDDTDALAEDYYRTEYYNSTTTLASTRSSIISAAEAVGFSEFTLQHIEDEVLSELRDPDAKRRSREEIDRDVNNAVRELMNTVLSSVREDYLNTYTTIDFDANRREYFLPSDFRKLARMDVSYNGSDYEKACPMRIGEDDPNMTYSESFPYYYLRDNVIGILPEPTGTVTAGIKMWYDRRVPSMKNEGDELPYILRDYKNVVVDFALYKANMSENEPRSREYRASFEAGKKTMVMSLKDRDPSTNKSVKVTRDSDLYGWL